MFAQDDLYRLVLLECNVHWPPLTFTVNSWLLNIAMRVRSAFPTMLAPLLGAHCDMYYTTLPFMEGCLHGLKSVPFVHAFISEIYCLCSHLFLLLFNTYYFSANLSSRIFSL